MRTTRRRANAAGGTALLAVLWLTAALSAIAFTVASTVRAETERTATDIEALRAGYLASGAIDRALLYIQWGPAYRNPDGSPKYFSNPTPVLHFDFPTGQVNVEIIPESAKLDVNKVVPQELMNLLLAVGLDPARAQATAAAIVDWRSPTPGGSFSQFDQHYLSMSPSFQPRHASFQEIEELLLVQGVTPDLFYGSYTRDAEGNLVRHAALRECLSVYGSRGPIDANTAEAAVMQAVGVGPSVAAALVARRMTAPFRDRKDIDPFLGGGPGSARITIAPSSIATLRATARLRISGDRFSDIRKTVSALVKFLGSEYDAPFHIMRWYDNVAAPQ